MAKLSLNAQKLIQDGNLSQADVVGSLGPAYDRGEISRGDIQALATRFSDALEGKVDKDLYALLARTGGFATIEPPIRNINKVVDYLSSGRTLSADSAPKEMTKLVQRALIALANRTDKPELMLPAWGADADYGSETQKAVTAFRASVGLPAGDKVDLDTAKKLNEALTATAPPPFVGPGSLLPGAKDVVEAAQFLVEHHADHYGVPDPWFSIDPNHAMGTGEKPGLRGKWKCNLFACQTLVKAGFEPPYYTDQGHGNYPIANELFKWSRGGGKDYSRQYGTKAHFDLIGEANVEQLPPENRKRVLGALLAQAKPGDLIIVDHRGNDGADGGHCRVVIDSSDWNRGEGSILAAQASSQAAEIQNEKMHEFTGEERVWILRPNRPKRNLPS